MKASQQPHVIVMGRASRSVQHDRATLHLYATVTDRDPKAARALVLERMHAALGTLDAVAHRERQVAPVHTQRVERDLRPLPERHERASADQVVVEYQASKSASVRYTIENARTALQALSAHPDVEVRWPSFSLSRARHLEVRSELLAEAVHAAKSTAQSIAEAAGRSVDRPFCIDEARAGTAGYPQAQAMLAASAMPRVGGAPRDEEPPSPDAIEPGYAQVEVELLATYLTL